NQWRVRYGLSRAEADDRLDEAVAVIDAMGGLYPIGIQLDAGHVREQFASSRVVSSKGGARKFEPDFICFLGYAYMVLSYVDATHPEGEKVNFLIEQNGPITQYIGQFHSELARALEALGSASLSRLVGELVPREKGCIPLQAADVLLWHTARSAR